MATGRICFAVRIGYCEGKIYLGTAQSDNDAKKWRAHAYPSDSNSNSPKMSIFEIDWCFQGLSYKPVFKWALNKQGVTHIFADFKKILQNSDTNMQMYILTMTLVKNYTGMVFKDSWRAGAFPGGSGFKPGQLGLRPFWSRSMVFKRGCRRSSASRAPTSIRWVQSTSRKAKIQLSQKPSLLVKNI